MLRVVMIFMLMAGGSLSAQNDDDQKDQTDEDTRRPSWSSGLPERQKPELQRPGISNDLKKDMTMDRSELGLERPKIEYTIPQENTEVPAANQQSEQQVDDLGVNEPTLKEAEVAQEPALTEQSEPEAEKEPATYDWAVVEQGDVEFPSRGVRDQITGWVDVEVTLNPQGDVVSAKMVEFSDEAGIYVEAAEESLSNWVFQAPADQGVNDLVSKIIRVDFVPPVIEEEVATDIIEPDSINAAQSSNEVVASNDGDYQWQVLNQVPLEYPMAAARKRLEGWVDIIVTINPDGDVIELKDSNHSLRGRVFVEPAKSSIVQWQFEPPKNQGINENVSRSYRIEFEL